MIGTYFKRKKLFQMLILSFLVHLGKKMGRREGREETGKEGRIGRKKGGNRRKEGK